MPQPDPQAKAGGRAKYGSLSTLPRRKEAVKKNIHKQQKTTKECPERAKKKKEKENTPTLFTPWFVDRFSDCAWSQQNMMSNWGDYC